MGRHRAPRRRAPSILVIAALLCVPLGLVWAVAETPLAGSTTVDSSDTRHTVEPAELAPAPTPATSTPTSLVTPAAAPSSPAGATAPPDSTVPATTQPPGPAPLRTPEPSPTGKGNPSPPGKDPGHPGPKPTKTK